MTSELVAALSKTVCRGSRKKFSPNGSFYNMLPNMVQLSPYRHTVGRSKAPNCLVVTPIGLYHINTRLPQSPAWSKRGGFRFEGRLCRGSLDSGRSVRSVEVLDIALLAVLCCCAISPSAIRSHPAFHLWPARCKASRLVDPLGIRTHRPLGKSQIRLATALGDQSLLLLQASAHGAGSDGEVAVVAAVRESGSC